VDENDKTQRSSQLPIRLADAGLFLELGSQREPDIERFKRGVGPLTQDITSAVEHWREALGIDCNTEVIPVVLLYGYRRQAIG
jgi:hypothetical protein